MMHEFFAMVLTLLISLFDGSPFIVAGASVAMPSPKISGGVMEMPDVHIRNGAVAMPGVKVILPGKNDDVSVPDELKNREEIV